MEEIRFIPIVNRWFPSASRVLKIKTQHKMDSTQDIFTNIFSKKIDIEKLAVSYGTPLFVFSEHKLRSNIEAIKKNYKKHLIYYASKANSNLTLLKIIKDCNLGIEVSSEGDLLKALLVNFDRDKIVFNGPAKSNRELELAINFEIKSINIDSESELQRVIELASKNNKTASIALRVILDKNITKGCNTWNRKSKFGIEITKLPSILKYLTQYKKIKLIGFHLHMGSQMPSSDAYQELFYDFIDNIRDVTKHIPLNNKLLLNIGGGFPTNRRTSVFDINSIIEEFYQSTIGNIEKKYGASFFNKFDFAIEPGRILVANTAILISEIIAIKKRNVTDDNWIIINAGFETLLEANLSKNKSFGVKINSQSTSTNNMTYHIGGPLCDGDDIYDITISYSCNLKVGDSLIFYNVGAYNIETMTNFNGRFRAEAILIDSNSAERVIRKRDTFETIISQENYKKSNLICRKRYW